MSKRVKYILVAKIKGDDDSKSWEEPVEDMADESKTEEENGRALIDYFNSTLRSGEREREFVRVIVPGRDKMKTKYVEYIDEDTGEVIKIPEDGEDLFAKRHCDVCDCDITSNNYNAHLKSKKHANNFESYVARQAEESPDGKTELTEYIEDLDNFCAEALKYRHAASPEVAFYERRKSRNFQRKLNRKPRGSR